MTDFEEKEISSPPIDDKSNDPVNDLPPHPIPDENEPVASQIAGFWIRFLAFFIDWTLLGVICLGLGELLDNQVASLGEAGRVVGFIIATLYLGIMNSSISNGQTLGKKITKLKVVDKDGNNISLIKSIIRSAVLAFPLSLNDINASSDSLAIIELVSIGLWLGIALVYLYVFNTKTRQSIHDLIFQTYVVNRTSEGEIVSPGISKVHYYLVGALFIVLTVIPITNYFKTTAPSANNYEKNEITKIVGGNERVIKISISDGLAGTIGPFNTKYLNVVFQKQPSSFSNEGDKLAKWFVDYGNLDSDTVLGINLSYGYNLGLAKSITQYEALDKVSGWKTHLETNGASEGSMVKTTKSWRCGFFYFNYFKKHQM